VVVGALGRVGLARDEERQERWPRASASVVDGSGSDCSVEVAYRVGDVERVAPVGVGDCEDVAEGAGYQVLIDPDDPDHVALAGSRYDPWTPVAFAAALVGAAAWWTASTIRRRRRVAAALAGPWWVAAVEHRDEASALRATGDPRGTVRCWTLASGLGTRAVTVAGAVEPGGTLAIWVEGQRWVTEETGRSRPRFELPFRG
jgi:hypothetical protein